MTVVPSDSNVEVIYVSPTPLGEEMTTYIHTLLAMGPAQQSCKDRVHFVCPEHLESFDGHNLALSTLLLYSPHCLARIKRLLTGREAYIISATVTKDDLALAYKLGEQVTLHDCNHIHFAPMYVYVCLYVCM